MRLSDLVGGAAHVCGPETTIEDAAAAMAAAGHGSLGVVEGSALVGVVTGEDLARFLPRERADAIRRDLVAWDIDLFESVRDATESASGRG